MLYPACLCCQLQEEDSEEILDDADAELRAEEAEALAAVAAAAPGAPTQHRLQVQQQQRQLYPADVRQLLEKAERLVRPSGYGLSAEQVQEQNRARLQKYERQRELEQLEKQKRRPEAPGDLILKEALDGPFGAEVAAANALRQQKQRPVKLVTGTGEGLSGVQKICICCSAGVVFACELAIAEDCLFRFFRIVCFVNYTFSC
jgi:hypothetical protein